MDILGKGAESERIGAMKLDALSETEGDMATAALVAEYDGSALETLVDDGERTKVSLQLLYHRRDLRVQGVDRDGRSVAGVTTSQAGTTCDLVDVPPWLEDCQMTC